MPAVILCEKPAQARDLAKALGGATGKGNGWIDCPAARLTWAIGHLVETADPDAYDERYKAWRIDDLPIVPQKWILEPRKGVTDQLKSAIATLRVATVIYIATDAGREGELIAYEIIERAGVRVPIKRLWFSAQDEESLRRAWSNPREASETVRLFHAAQTRQRADWLFGMNLTRAATLVFGSGSGKGVLSYGRVQTPTLAMIVNRDREIENFKSRGYFELSAQVKSEAHTVTMKYAPTEDAKRVWLRADADALLARVANAQGVLRVKKEAKRTAPPKPYALSDLQGDANSRFGYSAQVTLDLAQSLYEKHKAISYPRSDCNFLPEEMAKEVQGILRHLIQTQVLPNHPSLAKPLLRKAHFDTTKLSDHHAIVPTPIRAPIEQMTQDERHLFDLIALRFAQMVMPDYEYEATTIAMEANGVPLLARGRVPIKMGWRDLDRTPSDEESEEDEQKVLPAIRDALPGKVASADLISKQTQPPKRYTEKTLLADMKNVQRLVEDPMLKQKLKETSGLGTEATRANIIETLKKREFVSLGGPGKRSITSTETGRRLIDSLPNVLTLPGLTAAWEDLLESVASGTRTREDALAALTAHMQKQLTVVINKRPPPGSTPAPNSPNGSGPSQPLAPPQGMETPCCPNCSKPMRWRINGKTKQGFFGCTGYPTCRATIDPSGSGLSKGSAEYRRAPDCPTCQKRMRLINGRRGPFFGCTNYPTCQTIVDVTTGSSTDTSTASAGRSMAAPPKPTFRRYG
jgi:DNA topoisomerase-3